MLQRSPSQVLSCPACGAPQPQRRLYSKNGCDIFRCEGCGLGRAEAASFDPGRYYTTEYFSGGHADGYADYLGAEAVLRREFARTADFVRRHKASGRLLEIGCAYGFFLEEARLHFEVAGIEIAGDAAEHCRSRGLRVANGIADEASLAGLGGMDVVVLLDVVEHLPDPHGTLSLCARHLRPGGIVVLTTGDFAAPLARFMGASWRLMTPPQHLWFFTPESMDRLAQRIGMRVEALDHPGKIVPAALILFQLRRMLGLRPRAPAAGKIGIPVNLFDAMRVVLRKEAAA